MKSKLLAAFIGVLCASDLGAREVDTHSWMTREAFERSVMNPNSAEGILFAKRLGFDRLDPQAVFRSPGLAHGNRKFKQIFRFRGQLGSKH